MQRLDAQSKTKHCLFRNNGDIWRLCYITVELASKLQCKFTARVAPAHSGTELLQQLFAFGVNVAHSGSHLLFPPL